MENVSIELPSRCRPYGIDPATVKISTIRGKEEKMIAEMNGRFLERNFADILRNLITGIAPEKLTIGDRKYIMLWLAINSYTEKVPVDIRCGSCGEPVKHVVDLSKLEDEKLAEDFNDEQGITLSDGRVLPVRLFRVEDEIEAERVEAEEKKPNYLLRYALSIRDGKTLAERLKMCEDMAGKDLAKIRNYQEDHQHGPVMLDNYVCKKCQYEGQLTVPVTLAFFFPTSSAFR